MPPDDADPRRPDWSARLGLGRLREVADRTPESRERYIDALRAIAIAAVVLGHWLITVITYDRRGRPTGHSALEALQWSYPITWLLQVMPLFFVVGGFANAASLVSRRSRGRDAIDWLQDRSGRLIRPTTALVVVLAAAALIARLLGAPPDETRNAVWVASIPLWFLSAYLVVVLLTPITYALHVRFGLAVPVVLVVLVALGDVARLNGRPMLAYGSFLFGWLAMHQAGFFWRDGRLSFRPRLAVPLLVCGATALVLLTILGPYPVNMIDVPGRPVKNASPPTVALLAAAALQLGLVFLLRDRAERRLRRPNPWRTVVGVNSVVLTIFLWHMSAVLIVVSVLSTLDLLPTPQVGTRDWWLWRLPWLAMLLLALGILVAIFGRIELRGSRRPARRPRLMPAGVALALSQPVVRAVLTVCGFVAVVYGLLTNNLTPKLSDQLFGVPLRALIAFLAGAAVLRLLRSAPDR